MVDVPRRARVPGDECRHRRAAARRTSSRRPRPGVWARDAIALELPEQILCRSDCEGLARSAARISSRAARARGRAGRSAVGGARQPQRELYSSIVRVGAKRSRKRRSWVTSSTVPAVVAERALELLDRLEVEVVRRLVEDEAVDAARLKQREHGAAALAGRERRAGRSASSPRMPNFASSVRASAGREARLRRKRVEQAARRRRTARAAGRARRARRPVPSVARPAGERHLTE